MVGGALDAKATTAEPAPAPQKPRRRRPRLLLIIALLFSAVTAAVGLVLDEQDIAIVNTFDRFIGDHRIAWLSPQAADQRSDIAVVLVTEDTLLDYESRSPVDRGLLAELIRAVDAAEPKAIGLDFIFDRRTSEDQQLLAAIRDAKTPIVLGSIDTRVLVPRQSLAIQKEFLAAAGRPYGHFILERKTGLIAQRDSTVRLVGGRYPDDNGPDAFSAMLARAAGFKHEPANRIISWLRPPADTDLFTTIEIPQHDPATRKPKLEGVFLDSWRELLKGRVVLFGGSMIDRDLHTTPLSVIDNSVIHGVFIQAQALAQRIDGNRDIKQWPRLLTLAVVAGIAFACFIVAYALSLRPKSFYYELSGLVLIGLLSTAAFWLYRVDIPSIALATAWVGGAFGGHMTGGLFRRLGLES